MTQFALLRRRRFLPLFITQALGALNDNVFRNALIVLATFDIIKDDVSSAGQLAAIATGLFILPFFLFSTYAGEICDAYDKAIVARWVKLWEIALCLVGALGFALSSIPLLLFVLFMLGAQSTFFGPIKYAILPQHLKAEELLAGNALVEAGTFVAVMLGSIIGSLLIDPGNYGLSVSLIMMGAALVGYFASRAIPEAPSTDRDVRVNPNFIIEVGRFVRIARQSPAVYWGIMGIAWFWTLGALYVSQLAPFTKSAVGGDQTAVTLYLTCFTVGIGVGSLLCNYMLRAEVSTKLIPLAAIGMSVFTTDLWLATMNTEPHGELLNGLELINTGTGLRVAADLAVLAVFSGLFSVPLYALVQKFSDPKFRSRIIAAGNIIIAAAMVVGAIVTALALNADLRIQEIFAIAAVCNLAAAFILNVKLRPYAR